MPEKELMIQLIQEAVGGCARHWAEVIADHLLANDFRHVPPKTKPEIDLTNKCGSYMKAVPLRDTCYIKCLYLGSIRQRSQVRCKKCQLQPVTEEEAF